LKIKKKRILNQIKNSLIIILTLKIINLWNRQETVLLKLLKNKRVNKTCNLHLTKPLFIMKMLM